MAYAIDHVDNLGGGFAHQAMLVRIKAIAEANGWVTRRHINTGENHELILQGEGLSGEDEIFVGFRCYQAVASDYYNIAAAVMVGYVSDNPFEGQPGFIQSGVPANNNRIDYFMTVNAQRIALCMKVGTPVYEHCYVGKILPYARPGEFRSPLACIGMLNGASATRFSDTSHTMGYRGGRVNCRLRSQQGTWLQPDCWPWVNAAVAGTGANASSQAVRPAAGIQPLLPIQLSDTTPNVYGLLDGMLFTTGFDSATENVLQQGGSNVDPQGKSLVAVVDDIVAAGGRAFVVLQDGSRNGFSDYVAMEMS